MALYPAHDPGSPRGVRDDAWACHQRPCVHVAPVIPPQAAL